MLKLWRERGYKIALWRDPCKCTGSLPFKVCAHQPDVDTLIVYPYLGYSRAVLYLINRVCGIDMQAKWFIIGGDDTEPDPNHTAEEIARQCGEHFGILKYMDPIRMPLSTFGVMQPTGDRFAEVCGVAMIEKVAGSAWIGREFARRMYGGNGPLWPEYTRFFMDEELQEIAIQYGVFQQRRDLIHLHRHYMRESDAIDSPAIRTEIPDHLKAQESKWKEEQGIFSKRKHARPAPFPGSEPIA